jgi:hypothetical protein
MTRQDERQCFVFLVWLLALNFAGNMPCLFCPVPPAVTPLSGFVGKDTRGKAVGRFQQDEILSCKTGLF